MSHPYKKLEIKKYPKKEHRNPAELKYWKKFKTSLIAKDELSISDIHFCQNKPNLVAVAVSARVDLYRLTRQEAKEEGHDPEMKPITVFRHFKEPVSCVRLRQDASLIAVGDHSGLI